MIYNLSSDDDKRFYTNSSRSVRFGSMENSSENEKSMSYPSDIPIQSKRFDTLKRSRFAQRLADDLSQANCQNSLVIGLYGAWGSGKTSIKNLILEANRKKSEEALPVVDFNPWQLSGTGSIPEAFFSELGVALTSDVSDRKASNRAKKLIAYSHVLQLAGRAGNSIGKAMPFMGVPLGSMVDAAGDALRGAGEGMSEGGKALDAHEQALKNSIREQKKKLSSSLSQLEKPILVIFDDIDRLTTSEILQVFQLVKANADFPNIIYLMLFERKIVADALGEISGNRGMEFLEKILQVGYHIPEASKRSIEKTLLAGINEQVDFDEINKFFEENRWHEIYSKGLLPFFRNLRHVHRFIGSFGFQTRHHLVNGSYEVNPVDLLGLETLRVFVPDTYELITLNQSVLTGAFTPRDRKDGSDWRKEIVDELCAESRNEFASPIEAILKVLFPALRGDFQGSDVSSFYRMNRICHPDIFKRYFTLSVGDEDLSRFEIDELLQTLSDARKFEKICRRLNKRGLLDVAFSHLEDFMGEYDTAFVSEVISGMGSIEDCFAGSRGRFVDNRIDHSALRIAFFGLKRIKSPAERLKVLLKGIEESKGLYIPLDIVLMQIRREKRPDEYLIEKSDMPLLLKAAVEKIRKLSRFKKFRKHPYLDWLLWRWGEWASKEEVKSWVNRQLKTPKDAVWLLSLLLGEMNSYGQTHQIFYGIRLSEIERFASIPKLKKLVAGLRRTKLSKREGMAVRAFRSALKRRSEGKADEWQDRTFRDYSKEKEIVV